MNGFTVKMSRLNPFRLLNSVPFGIMLMVLTALYIAMGSARPWLRNIGVDEWPLLRNWFDKTDLQYFNSWPLKTLMALLVANLIVVTWRKIPLTPPRYGVWCIHAGIITLICGTSMYYYYKVEGRVRLYVDPQVGPVTVDHFYDKDQRSLYVRIGRDVPVEIPTPTLPRFKEYDERLGNADVLVGRGLTGIMPALEITNSSTGEKHTENLAELIGCKGQQLKLDVVGFYPYAETSTDWVPDPASNVSGVDVTMEKVADSEAVNEWWLVGSDPRFQFDNDRALMDMRHVDASPDMVDALTKAAGQLFHLSVALPGQKTTELDVQIGKSYAVGDSEYSLKIERFTPNFPMFGTGEMVQDLTMLVTTPTQTFRRMVLQDKAVQTDFKLNDPTAGPMGKRQKAPLDSGLAVDFHVHDPYRLLPEQNAVKHTLLTPAGSAELIDIATGIEDVPSQVIHCPSGSEDIEMKPPSDAMEAPFAQGADAIAAPASQPAATAEEMQEHPPVKIHVERRDHIRPLDRVIIKPAAQRNRDDEDSGRFQLVKLKASMGNWSEIVYAPFAEDAGDQLPQDQWHGGYIFPPGAIAPLQVQLGNTRRPLPAHLTLDNFKLIPYEGASPDDPNAIMKDFVSTVTVSDNETGDSYTDVARMNHPIYFGNGSWLFFQAAFDAGTHQWTQLGVGNRPAIGIMLAGCLMVIVGLMYAFYIKPIIVRRMKQKAIERAKAEGKNVRTEKDLVSLS